MGEYVIDEKVSAFKFTNAYKVFDSSGAQIGAVEQQKVSGGAKAARLLLGSSMKALQAFKLDIKDLNGAILAGVERRGMSSGLRGIREINIYDGTGRSIGAIKTLFSMLKPKMEIMSPAGEAIGRIQGDWKGWNFTIADASGAEIGTVSKKWNGAMKELFTTADKYRVSLSPRAVGVYRVAIVAAAITIDMVLKETS
ncbi:MAG: hypothetical protein LBJ10_07150 [Clostridiales bacterium]|nr:hypothetical protein [Clostridiales bacterium]